MAILVDHSEVKDQSLPCISHLSGSQDFRHDLSLNKTAWLYLKDAQMRRCLLIEQNFKKKKTQRRDGEEDDDADREKHRAMRELAATSVGQL